ncbi:MAG: DinB family protein [Gemmatimonadota bacterium]|nr:MAG: DinB family protein [Gemmatimonadota bacterium]
MQYRLDQAVEILSRTPRTLRALLEGLSNPWIRATEGGKTWSAFDVVGHLIHGERTDWIPRARIILDHGESRVFEPFDRFAQERESRGRSLGELLDEFAALRQANVETLERWHLADEDLDRTGRHPEFGPVTLRQHLATWVAHDLGHIAQVVRAMAKQYREEVGPWKTYLRVLRD